MQREFCSVASGVESGLAISRGRVMPMTVLEMYAQHGSVSYGELSASRLRAILLGAAPAREELSRVGQALMEMPGDAAYDLAAELGVSFQALNARAEALCGRGIPA